MSYANQIILQHKTIFLPFIQLEFLHTFLSSGGVITYHDFLRKAIVWNVLNNFSF